MTTEAIQWNRAAMSPDLLSSESKVMFICQIHLIGNRTAVIIDMLCVQLAAASS